MRRRLGQTDRELAALAEHTAGADRAVQGLHEMLDDGQPEPGAAQLARPGLVDAVEPLEDARQVGLGDADAGILDFEVAMPVVAPPAQTNGPTFRRVLE